MARKPGGPYSTAHFVVGRTDVEQPLERAAVQNGLRDGQIPGRAQLHCGPLNPVGISTALFAEMSQVFGEYLVANNKDLLAVAVIPIWAFRNSEHRQMPVVAQRELQPLQLMSRLMEVLSAQQANIINQFSSLVGTLNDSLPPEAEVSQEGNAQLQPGSADPGTQPA